MTFNTYLKTCRESFGLTQEQLAQELYNFDEHFTGINAVTISRWERGITQPAMEKLKLILKLFQKFSDTIFPCLFKLDKQNLENKIFILGVKNLTKKVSHHIVNFPEDMVDIKKIRFVELKEVTDKKQYINIAHDLDKKLTANYSELERDNFHALATYPSSLFLVAQYQEQFFGLFFSIKLKVSIFEKIINFEMNENDITTQDLANLDEIGCQYLISFFAISEISATLLTLKFYAHLIEHQKTITNVARVTKTDEGEELVRNIGLKPHKEKNVNGYTLRSYNGQISDTLINDPLLKIIFPKD